MEKAKLVLFDFDGVIVDSGRDIYEATNYTLKELRMTEKTYEEIYPTMSAGTYGRFATWIEDEEAVQKAVEIYREYYLNEIPKTTSLFPQVKETISALCKDYRLGIVSNKLSPITREILKSIGLSEYFDVVIGCDMAYNPKPDPEGILKVLEIMEVAPVETFMVGDSDIDVIAGKAAGVKTIGVTYGIGNLEDLINTSPDYMVDNFDEILNITELEKRNHYGNHLERKRTV